MTRLWRHTNLGTRYLASERQDRNVTWSLCQTQEALRPFYRYLKLRNFTLPETHTTGSKKSWFFRWSVLRLRPRLRLLHSASTCIAHPPPGLSVIGRSTRRWSNLVGAPPIINLALGTKTKYTKLILCKKIVCARDYPLITDVCLIPRPHPDFISQPWRKIDFSPRLRDKSGWGLGTRYMFRKLFMRYRIRHEQINGPLSLKHEYFPSLCNCG